MDVTQWLGSIGFGVAGLLCLARLKPVWLAIGGANLYFCLDCLLDLRHEFRSFAIEAMGAFYTERGPYQIAMMIGAVLAGLAILAVVKRLAKGRYVLIAMTATALSAGLFALEIISLHAIDGFLYQHVGPALLIGWLWVSLALLTGLAAVSDATRQSDSSASRPD